MPISELRDNAKQSGLHTIPDGDDSISQKNDVVKSKSALSSKSAVATPSAKENSVFSPEQRKKIIPMLTRLVGSQGIARLSKNEIKNDTITIPLYF